MVAYLEQSQPSGILRVFGMNPGDFLIFRNGTGPGFLWWIYSSLNLSKRILVCKGRNCMLTKQINALVKPTGCLRNQRVRTCNQNIQFYYWYKRKTKMHVFFENFMSSCMWVQLWNFIKRGTRKTNAHKKLEGVCHRRRVVCHFSIQIVLLINFVGSTVFATFLLKRKTTLCLVLSFINGVSLIFLYLNRKNSLIYLIFLYTVIHCTRYLIK